jgi:hypothetical protein
MKSLYIVSLLSLQIGGNSLFAQVTTPVGTSVEYSIQLAGVHYLNIRVQRPLIIADGIMLSQKPEMLLALTIAIRMRGICLRVVATNTG